MATSSIASRYWSRYKPDVRLWHLLLIAPALAWAGEEPLLNSLAEGKQRFETHCGACHSLALPRSQHLDRATWKWVIDDMVNEFGAMWLTEDDQKLILDYLVSAYGPE